MAETTHIRIVLINEARVNDKYQVQLPEYSADLSTSRYPIYYWNTQGEYDYEYMQLYYGMHIILD